MGDPIPPLWLPVEAAMGDPSPPLWLPVEAAMGDQPTALVATGGSQDTLPTALAVTGGQLTALAASGGSQGSLPTDLSLPVEAAMERPAHRFGCQWRQQWATSPPLWLPVEAARDTLPDRSGRH